MPRILLTGFEPFGGETLNPSAEMARRFDGHLVEPFTVVGQELPCVFDRAVGAIRRLIDDVRPAALVMLGQAAGRPAIAVERVAINLADSAAPDNAGDAPADRPVVPGGPAAHFATLPVRAIRDRIGAAGIPAVLSNTAGTYVCNAVFYAAADHIGRAGRVLPFGFIHLPLLPEQAAKQADSASMAFGLMEEAVRLALAAAADAARPDAVG